MRNLLKKLPPYFKSISPASFFVACSVFFFFLFNILTPPLQAPDELGHLYRICQLSEGKMISQKTDQRVGGSIPYSVTDFALPFRLVNTSYHKVHKTVYSELLHQSTDPEVSAFRDFPNTAQYNIVSYLPQVSAFVILGCFNAPVIVCYYGARLAVFVVWMFMIFCSIRLMPFAKWLTFFLALLPMNLYISNSLSADTMTNGLAFLLIALVLHLLVNSKNISRKQMIILGVISVLLSLAKVVYMPLVLVILLIPRHYFYSQGKWLAYVSAVIMFSVCSSVWWSGVVMKNYIPDSQYNKAHRNDATVGFHANVHHQKEYILKHPFYFAGVVFNTVIHSPQPYLKSYIGIFGAFHDTRMVELVYWIAWVCIGLVVLCGSPGVFFSWKQRAMMIFSALSAFVCLLLSQHLSWDQVGSGVVELMQGRYLIPIIPVILLSLTGLLKVQLKMPAIMMCAVLVVNAGAAHTLYNRYRHIPYRKSEFFSTSLEIRDAQGKFETSDPRYKLSADHNITQQDARTGKSAIISSPVFPYVLGCELNDITGGDLVEVELWQKGRGASMVLSGKTNGCGEIYMANNDPDYTDSRGWEHVHLHYLVPGDCGNFKLDFIVHNPGSNTVLIDDVTFTIRRGKK